MGVVATAIAIGPLGWPLGGHGAEARMLEGDPAGTGATTVGQTGSVTDAWSRGGTDVPSTPTRGSTDVTALPGLVWPVSGSVVGAWDEPAGPYGPGHRGVDLAVDPGQRVAAMGAGVVGWAGIVAGTAWVSVDHAGGVRTTVGPMATIVVTAGQVVGVDTALGTATGAAHAGHLHAVPTALHVSVRIDGTYVDPASLVGRLVPTLLPPQS